jgi:antitoxin component of RelBE/YafQ-DinJ toxin-antitoxin module
MEKTEIIKIRVSQTQKKQAAKLANDMGISLSGLIRLSLIKAISEAVNGEGV